MRLPSELCLLLLLPLLVCCSGDDGQTQLAEQYNETAYSLRYRDVRLSQHYALSALAVASPGSQAQAEALSHEAYVAYQQMRYARVLSLLQRIRRLTRDEIELLSADVLEMKVAQRIGDGRRFFAARLHAGQRLLRCDEERQTLTPHQLDRLHYAETEMHIVSSTYYYYLGQDSAAMAEIDLAGRDVSLARDTSQWLYFHYMLGSGGLTVGSPEEVLITEFEHLLRTFTIARSHGFVYFEANALQSMASMFSDPANTHRLMADKVEACSYLVSQHALYCDEGVDTLYRFPLALAHHAVQLFIDYRDLLQTSGAYRTLGEVYFAAGAYDRALAAFQQALHLTESHHKRSPYEVIPSLSAIYERLSLAYAALGQQEQSHHYRNRYLDLLDESRQNRELDIRHRELRHDAVFQRWQFLLLAVLFVIVLVLAVLYNRRMRRRADDTLQSLLHLADAEPCHQLFAHLTALQEQLDAMAEDSEDARQEARHALSLQRKAGIERRAKLQLVHAIVPYLDRIIAETRQLQRQGCSEERLAYIGELSQQIMDINASLTRWIEVQKGQLRLHITTFPLTDVLSVLALSHYSYEQKGLTFELPQTDVLVKADKALTLFMINTLCDNARKFTPEGGRVSVGVVSTDDYVEMSVCDTGVGLPPEDVDKLNGSKVYDSSHLGLTGDNKGFGFGIMNCKGIIGSYQKLSSLFSVCAFGVESEVGQGSRFWFRLPRILSLLLLLLLSPLAQAQAPRELYDACFEANVDGRYEEALQYGSAALHLQTAPIDTALTVRLLNEMAIASLSQKDWAAYHYYNDECVRLHQLYSADASLASYCQRMEVMNANRKVLYILLFLSAVAVIVLVVRLVLRTHVSRKNEMRDALASLHGLLTEADRTVTAALQSPTPLALPALTLPASLSQSEVQAVLDELNAELAARQDDLNHQLQAIEQTSDETARLQFEQQRLYIMNQVLDNALSTIKHETMYFPARIRTMAEHTTEETAADLLELSLYYRQLHALLYEQALRQTEQDSFRARPVPLSELMALFVQSLSRRCEVTVSDLPSCSVKVDPMLLSVFADKLADTIPKGTQVTLSAAHEEQFVFIRCLIEDQDVTEESLKERFTALTPFPSYLVMRQIIREHDAHLGHPGLRLYADVAEEGYTITFTAPSHPPQGEGG